MPTIKVSVTTSLSPEQVLARLTDFGPARADAWSTVDAAGLTVHDHGPDWAEVTEGNKLGWERERYTWNADAGTVTAVTLESNLWQAGPGWDYVITPDGTGSRVDVTARRDGFGIKGKLVGALLAIFGSSMIKSGTAKALKA